MEVLIFTLIGILGAIVPSYLNRKYTIEPVKASALPSLIVGLVFYFLPTFLSESLSYHIPILFFGASFVGMVNKKILPHYLEIACAGVIFTILYLNASGFFNGYGGGLGTAACIAVLSLYGIKKMKTLVRFISVKKKSN